MISNAKIHRHLDEKRKLPDGWRWVKLGDVCRDISDGTHFTPSYVSEGVPFLSVKDVKEKGLSFADCRYITKEQHFAFCKRCKPEKGDVLYTKVGTTGIAKAIDVDVEFSIFVSVALLKLYSTIIPDYLEKVLNAPICREQAENLTQGMANRNLVLKDLKTIIIPLPPISEQKRIAGVLKEQMTAVESARAAAQARLEAVKALPAAFLRQVFPQPGQPLPDGWRCVKLGEVCAIKGGKRLPSGTDFMNDHTPYPYIRVVDFNDGTVDICNLRYLDKNTQSAISRYTIGKDDVYISIAGSIGIVGTIPDRLDGANLTENAAKLVICDKNDISRDYLARFLMSSMGQEFIIKRTNTVGQPKLALTRIATIPIPLPPLADQRRITGVIEEQMSAVDKARAATEAELNTINALPAALLRRAFSGEL